MLGLQGAGDRGHADRRIGHPHGAIDDLAARQIRRRLDLFDRGQRPLYFDFAVPSLVSAGIDPAEGIRQIAAGDGSVPAFQRIREKQYQVATVAEPLHLHGWQTIDELNRLLAGEASERLCRAAAPVHQRQHRRRWRRPVIFDPGNGYKDAYKKIWGK